MGPGILFKALLQSSFSLMVFGWTQIVMDIQPLIVIITGEGDLHGFTHTYVGAILIAVFSALSGKYLSELGLVILGISKPKSNSSSNSIAGSSPIKIKWWIAFLSAFIGSFSHVLLDSIMHSDVEPLFPFAMDNDLYNLISISALHKICLYSGLVGGAIYFFARWRANKSLLEIE